MFGGVAFSLFYGFVSQTEVYLKQSFREVDLLSLLEISYFLVFSNIKKKKEVTKSE